MKENNLPITRAESSGTGPYRERDYLSFVFPMDDLAVWSPEQDVSVISHKGKSGNLPT